MNVIRFNQLFFLDKVFIDLIFNILTFRCTVFDSL